MRFTADMTDNSKRPIAAQGAPAPRSHRWEQHWNEWAKIDWELLIYAWINVYWVLFICQIWKGQRNRFFASENSQRGPCSWARWNTLCPERGKSREFVTAAIEVIGRCSHLRDHSPRSSDFHRYSQNQRPEKSWKSIRLDSSGFRAVLLLSERFLQLLSLN